MVHHNEQCADKNNTKYRRLAGSGMMLTRRHSQFKPIYDLLGIAYLRLGEQQNCNLNPNTSICTVVTPP